MITSIENISLQSKKKDNTVKNSLFHKLSQDDLKKFIYDVSKPPKQRVNAIDMYYYQYDFQVLTIVNDYITRYLVSRLNDTEKMLKYIAKNSAIPIPYKFEICKTLLSVKPNYVSVLKNVINYSFTSSNVCYVSILDAIYYYIRCDKTGDNKFIIKSLEKIINNTKLEEHYRYKIIINLHNHVITYKDLQNTLALLFFNNKKNTCQSRIVASQLLFKLKKENPEHIYNILVKFINDTKLSIDVRMDAVDVLLQYGNETMKKFAQDSVLLFGYGNRIHKNIYNHKQNVHLQSISKSVLTILKSLKLKCDKQSLQYIQIPHIYSKIEKFMTDMKTSIEDTKLITVALNRISIDSAVYGELGLKLKGILLLVWKYIIQHKHSTELKKRLLQELIEMSGKCSSGYASRLVNTLSGFGDFSIKISYEDQITAYFMKELNSAIARIPDQKLKETVLIEMISTKIENKPNFLKVLRQNLSSIYQKLYAIFKTDITDTDFALYFKKAILKYEQ